MKRTLITAVAALVVAFSLNAQDRVVKTVLELGRTDNQTMAWDAYLSGRIGGRPVGSHALEDAEAWAAEQFKAMGLEVQVQEVGEIGVGFSRGPWSGRLLSEDGFTLHFGTPCYTAGTVGPHKGRVVLEPKSERELNRVKGVLKGAWVLLDTPASNGLAIPSSASANEARAKIKAENAEKEARNRDIQAWNRAHPDSLKTPEKLETDACLYYAELVEAGVAGFIRSSKMPMQVLYDRSNCYNLTMETLPNTCDILLEDRQFDIIRQKAVNRQDFQLEFDIRNHFFRGPVKYHNVIGILKGSKYPDEYVLIGGHLDAYDIATGSVDDGNGVSVCMEAARLLTQAGARPKRTILFCLWTGEEYGLLGSKYFVENKTVPLEKISNYFNRDGGPLAATGLSVPAAMYDDFEEVCKPLAGYSGTIPFTLEKRAGEPQARPTSAGGSDHAYFAMNGVPTISFREEDVLGYDFNYRDIWHTEDDLYDKVIPEYMDHSSVVTAVVAYGLANLNHILSREGLYKD